MKIINYLTLLVFILVLAACKQHDPVLNQATITRHQLLAQTAIPVYTYKIIKTYPHATDSFTEGLLLNDGYLYEGTGLYGYSKLLKLELDTGRVIKKIQLPAQFFGEGITILGDHIYQLTYESKIGFVYNKHTFKLERTFHYLIQGWGLTTDGNDLIMSDGSSVLTFINPKTLHPVKYLHVVTGVGGNDAVNFLNALAYIDGKIYANVWQTNFVAIISPQTGHVLGWIDLTGITADTHTYYELNGIAFNQADNTILVTGKFLPYIYAIKIGALENGNTR